LIGKRSESRGHLTTPEWSDGHDRTSVAKIKMTISIRKIKG